MQIIKGKSSAWIKKKVKNTDKLYDRGSLWARGYFVSSIGLDEHLIRRYVRHQYDKNQLEQPSVLLVSASYYKVTRPKSGGCLLVSLGEGCSELY